MNNIFSPSSEKWFNKVSQSLTGARHHHCGCHSLTSWWTSQGRRSQGDGEWQCSRHSKPSQGHSRSVQRPWDRSPWTAFITSQHLIGSSFSGPIMMMRRGDKWTVPVCDALTCWSLDGVGGDPAPACCWPCLVSQPPRPSLTLSLDSPLSGLDPQTQSHKLSLSPASVVNNLNKVTRQHWKGHTVNKTFALKIEGNS